MSADKAHIPAVSVVIACHNGEKYLREAVESILAQTFRDFELILVDDASTDGSPAIMDDYAARDPRVRVIHNERRLGRAGARNAGIAAARAPLLAIQDADDVSLPDRLEKQKRFMDEHPEIGVLACPYIVMDEDGRFVALKRIAPTGAELKEGMRRRCSFSHCSAMFRTEAVRSIGGYREGFALAEDYDMLARLVETVEVGVLHEAAFRYRIVPSGASIGWRPVAHATCDVIRELAAERAATGQDTYDLRLKEGRIPTPPERVVPGAPERYCYILAKIAVGEGEYRNMFRYLRRGVRLNPRLFPRALYLTFAMCVRETLKVLGLLRWYERRFLAK